LPRSLPLAWCAASEAAFEIDPEDASYQERMIFMKLVVAIIRTEKLQAVQAALKEEHVDQITISNVVGSGHERGSTLIYRSSTVQESLIPKLKLEIAVEDACVQDTIWTIQTHAMTGHPGDGVIFVMPLDNFVQIRAADRGNRSTNGEVRLPANGRLRNSVFATN
jgi:nitrogen regulatory protein P-II 2